MKYLLLFLIILNLCSCDGPEWCEDWGKQWDTHKEANAYIVGFISKSECQWGWQILKVTGDTILTDEPTLDLRFGREITQPIPVKVIFGETSKKCPNVYTIKSINKVVK